MRGFSHLPFPPLIQCWGATPCGNVLDTRPWGPPGVRKKYRKCRTLVVGQEVCAKSTLNFGGGGGRRKYPRMLQNISCVHLRYFFFPPSGGGINVASNLVTGRVGTDWVWTCFLMYDCLWALVLMVSNACLRACWRLAGTRQRFALLSAIVISLVKRH